MTIDKTLLTRLTRQHPHSAAVLKAFAPLLDAQNILAGTLAPPAIPPLDRAAFALGKAWLDTVDADPDLYLDAPLLRGAPKKIAAAAGKGLPEIKEQCKALGALLEKDAALTRELALFNLRKTPGKIAAFAQQHGCNPDVAALISLHLAAAAARRVERAAAVYVLPAWQRGYCPICGSRPHGSCLREKEGRRFLQCSLCRHEWPFSRTTCPACNQDSPQELPLFFLEERKYERAEGCNICKHYLLGVDMRELAGNDPLELYLLCMMPLDLLMQEKGFKPVVEAE